MPVDISNTVTAQLVVDSVRDVEILAEFAIASAGFNFVDGIQ